MKPFNLERAIAGDPLCTADGQDGRFIAYVPEVRSVYKILIFVDGRIATYTEDGRYSKYEDSDLDLRMKPITRTWYMAVHDEQKFQEVKMNSRLYRSIDAVKNIYSDTATKYKIIEVLLEE